MAKRQSSAKPAKKAVKSKPAKTKSARPKPAKVSKPAAKPARPAPKAPPKAVVKPVPTTASRNGTAKPVVAAKPTVKIQPAVPAAAHHNNGTTRYTEHGEPLNKTSLAPAELKEFSDLLTAKRQELIGDMNHLRSEALGRGSSGEGGGSSMPIHMADIGSDTWEQELTLGLIEKERGLLREIEEALDRIGDRTYGVCLATNKPITKARLRAKPWAKYCIEHARKRELGLG